MNKDARVVSVMKRALANVDKRAGQAAKGAATTIDAKISGQVGKNLEKTTAQRTASKANGTEQKVRNEISDIKNKPQQSSKLKSAADVQKQIKELEDFLNKLQIDLAKYKEKNDIAKIQETEKLIGQIKQRMAKLRGF
jgi:hypothetical protein